MTKHSKWIYLFPGILIIIVLGYLLKEGIFKGRDVPQTGKGRMQVVTSFYPLFYFATQIGGEKAEVINLTPAGAEPHDYEPNTQDISRIETSDLLIINGGQLEPWADNIRENMRSEKIRVLVVGENLATLEFVDEGERRMDPHVWLDPALAVKEAERIASAFMEADPENRALYEENLRHLAERLDALDQEFRQGLLHCRQRDIITSHAAFGYVASRYGLKQVPISGLSPDEEPSPKQLAEVAAFAKARSIKYIFFETLISPRLAETIAEETGAKTIVFNPLEGLTKEEQAAGKDYFSIQKENLENLKTALECK